MAPETARAAVESLPGVVDVSVLADHPAKIAGQVPMHVTTAAGFDWATARALLPARSIDLEVLHVTDFARNLDDLRGTEVAFSGELATKRHEAWRRMAEFDAETIALRRLLPQLDALAPGTGTVQDPRLLEVQSIVAAETAFWRLVLTPTEGRAAEPAMKPTPLPAGEALRIAPVRIDEASAIANALGEVRLLLGARRWIVARTSFTRIRTLCGEVAGHATATADKARDPAIAAKYRDLATRCTAAMQAIDAACKS